MTGQILLIALKISWKIFCCLLRTCDKASREINERLDGLEDGILAGGLSLAMEVSSPEGEHYGWRDSSGRTYWWGWFLYVLNDIVGRLISSTDEKVEHSVVNAAVVDIQWSTIWHYNQTERICLLYPVELCFLLLLPFKSLNFIVPGVLGIHFCSYDMIYSFVELEFFSDEMQNFSQSTP